MSQQPIDYAERPSRRTLLSRSTLRRLRLMMPYLAAAATLYVGSYICLSTFGRFEPAMIGAGPNGNLVKWYSWAPAGLVSGYRHRWGMIYFYLPLYAADLNFWHRNADAYSGKYPTSMPATPAEWAEWRR
jgi:hypothetical protein